MTRACGCKFSYLFLPWSLMCHSILVLRSQGRGQMGGQMGGQGGQRGQLDHPLHPIFEVFLSFLPWSLMCHSILLLRFQGHGQYIGRPGWRIRRTIPPPQIWKIFEKRTVYYIVLTHAHLFGFIEFWIWVCKRYVEWKKIKTNIRNSTRPNRWAAEDILLVHMTYSKIQQSAVFLDILQHSVKICFNPLWIMKNDVGM